jgi:two-component system, LytTR family, response regulator
MIRTVIVDDEQNNIEVLQRLLEKFCPIITVVGIAKNTETGHTVISQLQPQLVFLDIEMPFGNGFDLLERMIPVTFEVIFVTAFNQYAIKAFKYAALDYLLKPVSIEELKRAVNSARQHIEKRKANNRIEFLLDNYTTDIADLKKIGLPVTHGLIFEEIADIVHLKAEGNYTNVFTKDRKRRLVSRNLKEFEELLPSAIFCRIHHSHIVNLNYVKKYYKGRGGYIELTDGTTVEVSARKRDEFLEKFRL